MPQKLTERPSAFPVLDDAGARQAQIRAIAAGLVDGPRMGRRFHRPAGVPLQPSVRRRRHGEARRQVAAERQRGPLVRRLLGAGLLVAQVGALAVLLTAPAFRVHTIDVSGERLLSRDAVLAAARVPTSSLFTVDGDAIRARIAQLPWVRSVSVTTSLPSTIQIAVTEWQPDLVVRHSSTTTLVAADGATLRTGHSTTAPLNGVAVLLDQRTGEQPLIPGAADLLASAASRWTAVFGCKLDAFMLSSSNVLSAWCSSGWQAVFGALDSNDALAAIPGQLAALAALTGRVDLARPAFGYVDLENASSPAIGGHPGEPAWLAAAVAGRALSTTAPVSGAPPASASPLPAPATPATARPTPTPFVFHLVPPSPAGHR
jgi:POTRA domain, FtsQ-type